MSVVIIGLGRSLTDDKLTNFRDSVCDFFGETKRKNRFAGLKHNIDKKGDVERKWEDVKTTVSGLSGDRHALIVICDAELDTHNATRAWVECHCNVLAVERLGTHTQEMFAFYVAGLLARSPAPPTDPAADTYIARFYKTMGNMEIPLRVFVRGGRGVGKELCARRLHEGWVRLGNVADAYVTLNSAGISDTLLESQLMGHVFGAFSGAECNHAGLLLAAHKGTLFLDEIALMPPLVQQKLLRAVEYGDVRPVGAAFSLRFDARIVAATNASDEILEERLQSDLRDRLSQRTIVLADLDQWDELEDKKRPKGSNVRALVVHELRMMSERYTARASGPVEFVLTDRANIGGLATAKWPGNVRQLHSVVLSAVDAAWNATGKSLRTLGSTMTTVKITPERLDTAYRESVLADGQPAVFETAVLTHSIQEANDNLDFELRLTYPGSGWQNKTNAVHVAAHNRTVWLNPTQIKSWLARHETVASAELQAGMWHLWAAIGMASLGCANADRWLQRASVRAGIAIEDAQALMQERLQHFPVVEVVTEPSGKLVERLLPASNLSFFNSAT